MNKKNSKTIFITVSRGFIVRNILRSGVLEHLKHEGFRIVIFLSGYSIEAPQCLQEEFGCKVVTIGDISISRSRFKRRIYRIFTKLSSLLLSSKSTKFYSYLGNNKRNLLKNRYQRCATHFFSSILSKIPFLKKIIRYIEEKVFSTDTFVSYFEKYKPDIIFSTSVTSTGLDIHMMKEAKRRGIKTISMPKGWDDTTKIFYRFEPDILMVQNEYMKKAVMKFQRFNGKNIVVTGFPQFDWYKKQEILQSREEFCALLGLDPERKIIFFGSEGRWAPNDDNIASLLAGWIRNEKLNRQCNLVIRPHFEDAKNGKFNKFLNDSKYIVVDNNFTFSDFFKDKWNPGIEEIKNFINLVYHCDLLINFASTLTLDAACFDKPILNVDFNVLYHPKTNQDISHLLYMQNHFDWVFATNAVDLVKSEEELYTSINKYLIDPGFKKEERKLLVEKVCYKVDGRSSERIANAVRNLALEEK